MEACETDQFENHLRAVLGLPLGGTGLKVGASMMLNILGTGNLEETKSVLRQSLAVPGGGIHWYGKGEAINGEKRASVLVVPCRQLLRDARTGEAAQGDG